MSESRSTAANFADDVAPSVADPDSMLTALLTALLRGEQPPWPAGAPADSENQFLMRAEKDGVAGLLFERLHNTPDPAVWPVTLREPLAARARELAVAEMVEEAELKRVLKALAEQDIPILLMKGTPLAYSIYPTPSTRQRVDTDVLIRREDADRVRAVMQDLGYRQPTAVDGDLVSHQFALTRADKFGAQHTWDFHWKISNAKSVADFLRYDDVADRAQPVPALGPHARALGTVDALLLACVHRVAHHHDDDRLIWLYDIHLLAGALSEQSRRTFLQRAAAQGVSRICAQGVLHAVNRFATRLPGAFLRELQASADKKNEASAALLTRNSRLEDWLADLRALPTWSQRLRLLRQHAFPSAHYMLGRYQTERRALLPWLYLRRGLNGLGKLLRRR